MHTVTSKFLVNQRIVLLQGPMGPFFKKLDDCLRAKGARTFRICFNGGDCFFANKDNRVDFSGKTGEWEAFIARFLCEKEIDKIFLYGDCRFYHQVAIKVAKELGIQVFVFEEGYVRPNFITLEQNGVNAHSQLPRSADFYRKMTLKKLKAKPEFENKSQPITYNFHRWALFSIVYFVFMKLWRHCYPHNEHHRNTRICVEIAYGIRNALRKIKYAITERAFSKAITNGLSKKYYFVPLQVQYDFQLSRHSLFRNMEDFIRTVLVSFAEHAPADTCIVFKHHPMDRGRRLFYGYIRKLTGQLGVRGRVHVVHDVHLPTCLKHAVGTITINSTVGIGSLFHGTPTIVLGEAFYDFEGLTCAGLPLDRFWLEYKAPDRKLFGKFRSYLVEKTQLYGSFYGGFPEAFDWPDVILRRSVGTRSGSVGKKISHPVGNPKVSPHVPLVASQHWQPVASATLFKQFGGGKWE